jgi:Zn-dependent protease with chaperone function
VDFFGAQDNARRKTWQLAGLFAAAVVTLVVLTNLLIAAVYLWTARPGPTGGVDLNASLSDVPVSWWVMISLGVVVVVGLASGYKYLRVRGGGRTVAEAMGGRLLPPGSDDYRQRRLLNVVEEMAIASGTPVPPVYLVDEPSINAFAAGFGPDDAVVGVNQGTIDHLDRDELQGVIAHEFSHLLNGDSRLNLRLIAILHGILFLGLIGHALLRGMGRGGTRRSRGGGGAPGLALGLGLLVIGYAGTFFGNMIKAAVSRQREYLADAASVQFTRNPRGIAGALKKIGGLGAGSSMSGAAASEASHMFFGQTGRVFLNSLMSTHPPLDKRIRAVDPRWNGEFPAVAGPAADAATEAAGASAFAGSTGGGSAAAADYGTEPAGPDAAALEIHATPEDVVSRVGRLDEPGLERARALIGGLPEALREAAHDPFDARALVHALVVDADSGSRQAQLARLDGHAEAGIREAVEMLLPAVARLDDPQRLTLLEMSLPALKTLSVEQYRAFSANLVALIKADQRIDLLEWVLHRLLVKELRPHFEGHKSRRARHGRLEAVADEAAELLGALAREGRAVDAAGDAFAVGWQALELGAGQPRAPDQPDPNFSRLNRALAELRLLKPLQKPKLLKACAATVLADGQVSPRQAVLLQGVAATLDCPLPPTVVTKP